MIKIQALFGINLSHFIEKSAKIWPACQRELQDRTSVRNYLTAGAVSPSTDCQSCL